MDRDSPAGPCLWNQVLADGPPFQRPQTPSSAYSVRPDIAYSQNGDNALKFDLYLAANLPAGARLPVVVYFNMQGGNQRSWDGYKGWCAATAAMNMAAINLDGASPNGLSRFDE